MKIRIHAVQENERDEKKSMTSIVAWVKTKTENFAWRFEKICARTQTRDRSLRKQARCPCPTAAANLTPMSFLGREMKLSIAVLGIVPICTFAIKQCPKMTRLGLLLQACATFFTVRVQLIF